MDRLQVVAKLLKEGMDCKDISANNFKSKLEIIVIRTTYRIAVIVKVT